MRILSSRSDVFLAFILFVPFSLFGQVTFESFDEYNIGPSPQALKTGDFNNDGWPDIISANGTFGATKHVSIALNNQVGGFNITNLTALKGYFDIETAFFDNNSNLDFVASSLSLNMITIFLGNGNGTFSTTDIAAGTGPLDVLTGDFNEDTKTDIAVLHQSSDDVYIYYGDGLGGFGAPQIIPVDVQSSYFTTADFNNNNHLDLAVGANNTLNFYSGDGAGNFAAPTPTTGFFGFDYLSSADLDGDGNMDVVGAGSSLAFTVAGAGNGTFSAPAFLPQGGLAAFAEDFDNDGDLDVVSTKKGKFIYYPGDGSGTYSEYRRIQVGGGKGMVAGDWDKDGNLDLASASALSSIIGHLQITFGKGNGYFDSQFEYPVANNPRGLASSDFNGDGLEDLAVVGDGKLQIFTGNSNGTFTNISTQSAGTFPYDIEAIHINADTHVDLAVLDITANTVNLFTGDGFGVFIPAGNIVVTADFEMTVDDVNNDNKTDLILAGIASKNVQIFKGNGDGTFSLLIDIDMVEAVRNVLSANIGGDANIDLAVLVAPIAGPREIRFLQGDGVGGFTPAGTNLSLLEGGNTFTKEDFNNDGKIDFLSLESDGDIFTGNGDFTFSYTTTNTGVSLVEHSTEVKDIDGDGFVDLISGSDCSVCSNGGRIQINRGIGDGTFSAGFWSQSLVGGYRPIVADFNNDGKKDIASLVNNTDFDGLSILLNTSGPPPCDAAQITANPSSTSLCEGGVDHVLFVNSTGTSPITYQWQKDGFNIPGAPNSAVFTLTNYTPLESGVYRCIVTNACGNDTSAGATITINSSPGSPEVIDATDCAPASVELMATGSADGNYRWYTVQVGGTALVGEVNASFMTPLINTTTDYYVSITNGTCESSRSSVTATVLTPVAITTQPSNSNANFGDDVTFTITATGDNLSYQWKKDGADLAGETTASLLISNVAEADQGNYTCLVSNTCNSETSNGANLTVVVTGISQDELGSILIYPNPSDGQVHVQNNLKYDLEIKVFTVQGREVAVKHSNSIETTINLDDYPDGIYYCTISNGKTTDHRKVLVRK